MKTSLRTLGSVLLLLGLSVFTPASARAADHADSPSSANNSSADLADAYFFLDPNDNSRVILISTARGFIVPGRGRQHGYLRSRSDLSVSSRGNRRRHSRRLHHSHVFAAHQFRSGQIANVKMTRGNATIFEFSAPATVPSLAATAPTQVVTTDAASGVRFFAGETDDPFFFDIPAFSRFVTSVLAGTPDFTALNRARDTFAGYNVVSIAFSMPKTLLQSADNVTGLDVRTLRNDRFPVTLLREYVHPRPGRNGRKCT